MPPKSKSKSAKPPKSKSSRTSIIKSSRTSIIPVDNVITLSQSKYRILINQIFQKLVTRDRPTQNQQCVVIYGTPGAGKTTATRKYLKEQFPKSHRFLVIDRDELTFDYTTYFTFMKKYLKSIGMDQDPNRILDPQNITSPATSQYYRHLRFFLEQGNVLMNSLVELALGKSYNMVIYDPPYRLRFSHQMPNLSRTGYEFHLAFMFTPQKKIKQHLKSRNKDNLLVLGDSALKRLTTITVSDFIYMCLDGHDSINTCTVIDNSKTQAQMSQIRDWDFIYRFQKRKPKAKIPSGYERIKYE